MHQYSGVKKGYRPARTSRGYRSYGLEMSRIEEASLALKNREALVRPLPETR